jgi:hypothetical protein
MIPSEHCHRSTTSLHRCTTYYCLATIATATAYSLKSPDHFIFRILNGEIKLMRSCAARS